jgi:hypothetical protein
MHRIRPIVPALILAVALSFVPAGLRAQTWSPQQQEVWTVVQAQWQASMAKDAGWTDRFLHPEFRGWTVGEPTPRNRESAGRWARYNMEGGNTLVQDLVPMAIVVHGNTAVVHYYYS